MSIQPTNAVTTPGLKDRVIEALRGIHDPEIPLNIYELGLIYRLEVDEATGSVAIDMTLTTPMCPVAQTFPGTVEGEVRAVPGVNDVTVALVWDPPWDQERMTEAARACAYCT